MMTTRQRQLRCLGHVIRKDELENVILTGKIEGKRSRGGKRPTYISSQGKNTREMQKGKEKANLYQ